MKKSFAYLGPKGTFTEAAFLQMPAGQNANLIPSLNQNNKLDLYDISIISFLIYYFKY